MKHGLNRLCVALILGSVLAMTGCRKKEEPKGVQDLNSVRTDLREQVASGELTREEAIVRLAEVTKEAKLGSRKTGKRKGKELSPELEAFGKDLKTRTAKGELTAEEAKAAWAEALGKSKEQSNTKETGASTKE